MRRVTENIGRLLVDLVVIVVVHEDDASPGNTEGIGSHQDEGAQ